MAYGITMYNSRGGIQFDSTKNLETFVVTEVGNATSVTYTDCPECFLFVRGSNSAYTYYREVSGSSVLFKAYDYSTSTEYSSVSMDYFIVNRANTVTIPSDQKYGLQIANADGSIQFDTRSFLTNYNFKITNARLKSKYPQLISEDSTDYASFGPWSKRTTLVGPQYSFGHHGLEWRSGNVYAIGRRINNAAGTQDYHVMRRNQAIYTAELLS